MNVVFHCFWFCVQPNIPLAYVHSGLRRPTCLVVLTTGQLVSLSSDQFLKYSSAVSCDVTDGICLNPLSSLSALDSKKATKLFTLVMICNAQA